MHTFSFIGDSIIPKKFKRPTKFPDSPGDGLSRVIPGPPLEASAFSALPRPGRVEKDEVSEVWGLGFRV